MSRLTLGLVWQYESISTTWRGLPIYWGIRSLSLPPVQKVCTALTFFGGAAFGLEERE